MVLLAWIYMWMLSWAQMSIKHEPGLLLHWLKSSSLTDYGNWAHCEDWLIHREKSRKAWPDLPSLPLKWGHLSRFHQDRSHWCCNTNFCFWFFSCDLTRESWCLWKQPSLLSFVVLSPLHKHHRFREVWNAWWMLPKAKSTPNITLTQKCFISVFNFSNEILHQGL